MAHRFSGKGGPYEGLTKISGKEPRWTGKIMTVDAVLDAPLRWKRPRTIFVNSMSDLFHKGVPDAFIGKVFDIMRRAHWHSFQILTKRPERSAQMAASLPWPDNVWLGTSIESAAYLGRTEYLRRVPAAVRFLSLEPLLGPLPNLALDGIDWVIVGGESGPGARPMAIDWVREIRDRCIASHVPFFFKQWGGVRKKEHGRELDNRTWDELPKGNRGSAVGA